MKKQRFFMGTSMNARIIRFNLKQMQWSKKIAAEKALDINCTIEAAIEEVLEFSLFSP
jgi:hypothetical protein